MVKNILGFYGLPRPTFYSQYFVFGMFEDLIIPWIGSMKTPKESSIEPLSDGRLKRAFLASLDISKTASSLV